MPVSNKNSKRNKCLFWGVVFLIWLGVIVETLWAKGYQHQRGRLVTEEEMIRMAATQAISLIAAEPPEKVYYPGGTEPVKAEDVIPYRDADHFFNENPNCCKIVDTISTRKYINVSGKIFYRDKTGQIQASEPVSFYKHIPSGTYAIPPDTYRLP